MRLFTFSASFCGQNNTWIVYVSRHGSSEKIASFFQDIRLRGGKWTMAGLVISLKEIGLTGFMTFVRVDTLSCRLGGFFEAL